MEATLGIVVFGIIDTTAIAIGFLIPAVIESNQKIADVETTQQLVIDDKVIEKEKLAERFTNKFGQ